RRTLSGLEALGVDHAAAGGDPLATRYERADVATVGHDGGRHTLGEELSEVVLARSDHVEDRALARSAIGPEHTSHTDASGLGHRLFRERLGLLLQLLRLGLGLLLLLDLLFVLFGELVLLFLFFGDFL